MARLLDLETEQKYGPEFVDENELNDFASWHETGDQRSLVETEEDGDLSAQVEWWRSGGHLLIETEG